MPSNLLSADTGFPQFTAQTSDGEKIEQITSYLFMLLEQLRYILGNLDGDNFNEAGLAEIGREITAPVYVRLEGAEGEITRLDVTARGLTARMENAEGDITSLTVTAQGLGARISNAEGDITSLTATAQGLGVRISNAEGDITSLTATVNGLRLNVSNGSTSSTISLTANGAAISSQTITMSGLVTFMGLADGTTTINGGCIQTGTISAVNISGCTIEGCTFRSVMQGYGSYGGEIQFCYLQNYMLAGGIRLDDQGVGSSEEARYRMFLYTRNVYGIAFAMKLESAGGLSLETPAMLHCRAGGRFRVDAPTIELVGSVWVNGVQI